MLSVCLEKHRVDWCAAQARPRRPGGFALIRLLYGGICNTDLELQRGYYGFRGTPGHEFVGEVVEADDRALGRPARGGRDQPGVRSLRLVRARPGAPLSHAHRARNRETARRVPRIPDAARAQSASRAARYSRTNRPCSSSHWPRRAKFWIRCAFPRGAPVAVLGRWKARAAGQARFLHAHGCRVHQYGRHKEKLRIAELAGVDTEIAQASCPWRNTNSWWKPPGRREGLQQAVQMTQPRGTVIMKSTVHGLVAIDTAPVIVNEITLVGSRCGRFEPALRLLQTGRRSGWTAMISEVLPLQECAAGVPAGARKPGVLKVLLHA